jgi:hypothetical protein
MLRTKFTGLREVALCIPDSETDTTWAGALEELCRMLEDGVVDVVRFIMDGCVPEANKHWRT